jgi:hypothetical protein
LHLCFLQHLFLIIKSHLKNHRRLQKSKRASTINCRSLGVVYAAPFYFFF